LRSCKDTKQQPRMYQNQNTNHDSNIGMCIYRTDRAATKGRSCCNPNVRTASNVATQKYYLVKTRQKIKAKTREYSGEWTDFLFRQSVTQGQAFCFSRNREIP